MKNKGKVFSVVFLLILFFAFLLLHFLFGSREERIVTDVISPYEFVFDDGTVFRLEGIETFSADYTEHNKELANSLNITEDEAFILGNFGKYWAKNLVQDKKINVMPNDLVYYKFGYTGRFKNSPFALKDGVPVNKKAYERQLAAVRRGNFVIFDLDKEVAYPVSKENRDKVNNYVIVRKNHIKNSFKNSPVKKIINNSVSNVNNTYKSGNIKILLSDLTTKIFPDRNCSSVICQELLNNIDNAKNTIDMAIYGYSSTPYVEKAIERAKSRGVKIRLVYDIDTKGQNIYPETFVLTGIIPDSVNDFSSAEAGNSMHNKFYIFDNRIVITGSANLSHTDMSGYNTNSVIVINSSEIAKFYTEEFNQMYSGKFHNDKISTPDKTSGNITVYFSPEDKAITNGVLPLIMSAKKYIYVSAFVITEKRITTELINAKNRGVDVKITVDALNASTRHSKHRELRIAGIPVKAENYAGKMHSKSMIIDDEYLIIGSMNFSNSGENRNDENMIVLKDSGASEFYRKFFIYQWERIPDKWLKYIPRAEGTDSVGSCSDGIDNNYDGKTDNDDEACRGK